MCSFETFKVLEGTECMQIITAPLNQISQKQYSLLLDSIKQAQTGRNFINFTEKTISY